VPSLPEIEVISGMTPGERSTNWRAGTIVRSWRRSRMRIR
jgi:hypothetical protein